MLVLSFFAAGHGLKPLTTRDAKVADPHDTLSTSWRS